MAEQTEKAFQFHNHNGGKRWFNNVGLGFKTPQEAISGTYIDKKCPFTSPSISIRGRILTGVVKSTKMKRTIIIRREYLHFVRKYNRFEKRHKNLAAHISPCFIGVQPGDTVTVGQCRFINVIQTPLKNCSFQCSQGSKESCKGSKVVYQVLINTRVYQVQVSNFFS
jgi:small subunit ribosomal protein S11e